jgi:transposase
MSRRPPEDRGAVVFLHKEGLTTPEICRKTGFDRRFVTRWVSRYNDSGSLDDAAGAGRKRNTFEECGADCGEENEGEKAPLESSDREELKNTEGCRCELLDSAEDNAPPRLARIQTA